MTKKRYIETLLLSALSALAFLVVGCSDADDGVTPPVIESVGEPLQVSHFTRYGVMVSRMMMAVSVGTHPSM